MEKGAKFDINLVKIKFRLKPLFGLQEMKENINEVSSPWKSKFFKKVRFKYFKIEDNLDQVNRYRNKF